MKLHVLAFALVVVSPAFADDAGGYDDLTNPCQNAFGFAGWGGEFNSWWKLGCIQVSDKFILPIRINFNSAQAKVSNSILGWNWWLPVVESTIVKTSENQVTMNMIGGKTIDLWKSRKDPNIYQSYDRRWKGANDDRGNFICKDEVDGIKILFAKGRIRNISLLSGEILTWDYDDKNRPLTVKNSKDELIMSVSYDSSGFPENLQYKDRDGKYRIIQTKVEAVRLGPDKLFPVLSAMEASDNDTKTFTYEQDVESVSLLTAKKVGEQLVPDDCYRWSLSDSKIQLAEGMHYKVDLAADGFLTYSKTLLDGRNASYHYNPSSGVGDLIEGEETIQRKYINSAGPNFSKIREVCKISGENKEVEHLFYAENGTLLRHIISDKTQVRDYRYESANKFQKTIKNLADESEINFIYENGSLKYIEKKTSENSAKNNK